MLDSCCVQEARFSTRERERIFSNIYIYMYMMSTTADPYSNSNTSDDRTVDRFGLCHHLISVLTKTRLSLCLIAGEKFNYLLLFSTF